MQRAHGMLWRFGVWTFVGMGLVSLMIPWPAQAGGVHVSVGFGIPVPVVVEPAPVVVAPAPVVVQPAPVYTQPAPVYVQPAPVVVQRPPVVVQPAPVVVAEPYAGPAYYPYYGHGWWKRARHWHHHGYDR
jgi:hypothetical protein